MRQNTTSRSGVPLLELLLAIGIFALASALIVRLFLGAHYVGLYTTDKNQAMLKAQSAAEVLSAKGCDPQALSALGLLPSGEGFTAQFDRQWNPVAENGLFVLTVRAQEEDSGPGRMLTGQVELRRSQPYPFLDRERMLLFSLPVSQYQP